MTDAELIDHIERTVRDRLKVIEQEMELCEKNADKTGCMFCKGEHAAYCHVLIELYLHRGEK